MNFDYTNINMSSKKISQNAILLFLCLSFYQIGFSQNPSNSFGNTFVHSTGNLTIFGEHEFQTPAMMMGTQPGIVGTERIPTLGYINFADGGTWKNAEDSKFVDGYVRHFGNNKFLFPIGDNDAFRPAAVSGGGYVEASYFGVNPTVAITSDIRGGFFPVLPASGPFDSNSYGNEVIKVSEYEYWDINGLDNTIITLTWDENSNVDIITANDIERLSIVGWDGSKWVAIPSYLDDPSIATDDNSATFNGPPSNMNRGSISTKIPIAPSDYEVYTLGSSCINMPLETEESVLICAGDSVTLTASSYEEAILSWSTGQEGNETTLLPSQTEFVTVTATLGSCALEKEIFVQVIDMNVELGIDTFACSGNDIEIIADGTIGGSYKWEHRGIQTFGDNVIVLENLNTPSTLNVTITDSNGCTDTDNLFIDIIQSPDVFTGRDASICQGDSTFLQAFGAEGTQQYQWSTGDVGELIYVSPFSTTTYEVSLTENGCTDVSFVTVEVFPKAFVEILTDSITCLDQEITIETIGTPGDYIWSNGETTPSITVSVSPGDTYSVTMTSLGNCVWTDEITFISYESTIDIGEDKNICAGETVNIDVDGFFDTVEWSTGETTFDINVTPTATTSYSVTTTYGGCTATDELTIFVDNNFIVDLGADITICRGESVELSTNAIGQYTWDTGDNSQSITVSPFTTTTYSVTVSSGQCIDTDEVTVIVSQEPAFVEILTDPLFCVGTEVLLETNGSEGDYVWSNGQEVESFPIYPLDGQVYSVTTTNIHGCSATTEITFEAFAENQINLGEDKNICLGEELILGVMGGYETIIWSNGSSNQNITVSPLTTTTYSVTTTLNGCESSDTITINVTDLIEIDLGEDLNLCAGESIDLTINDVSGDFLWSTNQTGNSITVNPNISTTYSVTVTSGSCEDSDTITINVEEPFVSIIGEDSYCPGESVILSVDSSPGTYLWSTGVTSETITVTPSPGITYSVTVTSSNNCSAVAEHSMIPLEDGNVDLGQDIEICEGGTVTLNLEGNYDQILWGDGSDTNSITVAPTSTTTYSVTATVGTCSDSDEITVNVVENFTVNLGPDQIICDGESTILSSSAGGEFLWSTGENTSSIEVSPGVTTTYGITVTSGLCSASDEIIIEVEETPIVTIIGEPTICIGESAELMADGPDGEYDWITGETLTNITVTPAPNETYSVTFTSPNGCIATDDFTFESFSINSIDLGEDISICAGEEVTINLEGVYDEVLWSTGETGNQIVITPNATTTISVTAFIADCSSSDEININVLETLDLNLGEDINICSGQTVSLEGNIAGQYVWSNGSTENILEVSPTATTTYTATVTSGGCQANDEITVIVENVSYVNIISPSVYCPGNQVTLEVEGSVGSYAWSTGQNGESVTFAPTSGETYYVTVTSPQNCVATDSITLNAFDVENIDLGEDIEVCEGETVTLNVDGTYDSLLWNDGTTDDPKIVTANQTETYSVTALYQGCSSTDEVTINVNQSLSIDLGPDVTICQGESVSLSSNIGGQYLWSTGQTTPNITISPINITEVSVTVTSGTCTAEDQLTIFIDESFIDIITPNVFCEGQEVTVETISSGGDILWSTGETTEVITMLPVENASYSVTVTSTNGCKADDEIIFTQFDNGDISLGPNITICAGSEAVLNVSGIFDSVIWDDESTSPTRVVAPLVTTTYNVIAQNGECLSFDEVTVFVEEQLSLDLGSNISICPGQSVELSDLNTGGSYLWSTNETTPTIIVSPPATTTYSVTVTSDNCVAQDEITVFIENICTVNLYTQKTTDNFNPKVGDIITFSIIVGNSGDVTATNIEITEEIRSGFLYLSDYTTVGDYNENTSIWYIDEIPPGQTELLGIQVEVLENGDHSNVVEITKVDQEDDDPINDDDTIDIEVDIDVDDPDNTSEIGDRVWIDVNGDGKQDVNEIGLENVIVELYSSNGISTPIETTTTVANGYFCFTGLSSGVYFVKFIIPDNYVFTDPNVLANGASLEDKDSDVEHTFGYGTTNALSVGKNEQNKQCDAGIYLGGSIGDLVWEDAITGGRNDVYDSGLDNGFEGAKLYLFNGETNAFIDTTRSDVNGFYQFTNLRKGQYYLTIEIPDNRNLVVAGVQSDDIDSDFDNLTLKTPIINLAASEDNMDIDAGINPPTVPLTLVDFWGERQYDEGFNRLFWITQIEVNTDRFEIERSMEQPNAFLKIDEVEAAGNSVEELYYTYDDLDSRFAGVYYYRLKIFDLNGSFYYSPIIVIKVDEDADEEDIEWKVFPIPTTDYLTIEIGLDSDQEFKGFLVNNLGQHVRTFQKKMLTRGKNLHTIDVIDLAQGQYYLNFYIGKEQFISKVLVLD
ncbi:MAG: DUF11 domain-containing protein [Saprospiraceae bacterium]|nr:DUF11 domain-containing protein [Saprospiraceae bacterium]